MGVTLTDRHEEQSRAEADPTAVVNAFTVDIEDWYHGIELNPEHWSDFESRIASSVACVLAILDSADVKATFFALGRVAEEHPETIRMVAAAGHEIAVHGLRHQFIHRQSSEEFVVDLKRAIGLVEDLAQAEVHGYRAPFFSITKRTLWALEILAEHGIRYDSSIFPVRNYRYGIPRAPRFMYSVECRNNRSIIEAPISTLSFFSENIPFAGGAYLRLFPYSFIRWGIRSLNENGHPAIVYVHPWEFDPDHPRIKLPLRIGLTHYLKLKTTEPKIKELLREFRFDTLSRVVSNQQAVTDMKKYSISDGRLDPLM